MGEPGIDSGGWSVRYRHVLLGVIIAVCASTCGYYASGELIDDAFIFFRYAANWASGIGPVFNVGERVEGYTSFLWLAALTIATCLGANPELAVRILGLLSAISVILATATLIPPDRSCPAWLRLLPAALLAISQPFCLWSVHGLETPLFTLLVTLGIRSDLRSEQDLRCLLPSGLWYALATLTRPEGAYFFAASLILRIPLPRSGDARRDRTLGIVAFSSIVGAHGLWRWMYYHALQPNTFHAKVGFTLAQVDRGLDYVGSFFVDPGGLLFLLLVPAGVSVVRCRTTHFLFGVTFGYLTCVVLLGGDAFPSFRFIVPVLPVLYVLVARGVQTLMMIPTGPALNKLLSLGTPALVVILAVPHVVQGYLEAYESRVGANAFVSNMRLVGLTLLERVPPDTTIALNPVGAVPYYSRLPTIDMLGLTDAYIAATRVADLGRGQAGHERGDGRYVLERRPDMILIGNVNITAGSPESLRTGPWPVTHRAEIELVQLPDFRRLYVRDVLPLNREGYYLPFIRRRGFEVPGSLFPED